MKMEKGFFVSFALVLVAIVTISLINSCGQQSTSPTTTTTLPPGSTFSISLTLKSGTVSGASVGAAGLKTQAVAQAPLSAYNIVAVSKDTGVIYFSSGETDASGNATIPNLPAGESFYVDVLDSNMKLAAPISFGSSGGKAIMAVESSTGSNISLGDTVIDSTKDVAAPVTPPTTLFDSSASVETKSGETLAPKGAGNLGKGSLTEIVSGTYDPDVADGDKDGLPNLLDADNNGDLVADEFDGLYTNEVFSVISPPNFYTYAFTNLKVDWAQRDTFNQDYSTFSVALGVTANSNLKGGSAAATKTISSCKVIQGPAWISSAYAISGNSRTLWSTSNYDLPSKTTNVWEVQLGGNPPSSTLKPGVDVTAGDALKIQVTYTDGTSEESIKMINFVFTDIPRVIAYKIGSNPWTTSNINFPTNASTSEVALRWTRPLDEASHEVIGARYTFEYNSASGGAIETTVITKDADATLTSLEAYVDYATLPDAGYENVSSHQEFMIGVCVRSVANDNSAENVRFQKAW